ncbi:YqgE/AlgH family protein [Acidobacteria bacterium AH-259-D05]|nr:YqgE/AlgH family protein [Acidobacteria bacterium AH-259-D05]
MVFFSRKWLQHLKLVVSVLGLALLLSPVAQGGWGRTAAAQENRPLLQENVIPEKGVFLVASNSLVDPRFRHSVVLLVSHGQEGTLGLIINRASEVPLSDVLPDLEGSGKELHVVFFGGPVGLDGLLFLTRSAEPPERATQVMADVYFSGDRELLQELIQRGKNANELRVYLGRSGWAPGQLEAEIARGSWQLVRGDAHTVFEKDLDDVWRDLIEPLPTRRFIVRHGREPAFF